MRGGKENKNQGKERMKKEKVVVGGFSR